MNKLMRMMPLLMTGCAVLMLWGCTQQKPLAEHSVTVIGQGAVTVVPDVLEFSIQVEERGKDATELQTRVSQQVTNMVVALQELGVDESNLRSMTLNLRPWYEYRDNRQTHLGFIVSQSVDVSLEDFARYPSILNAVLANGASQITGFNYRLKDQNQAYAQALEQAMDNAMSRAKVLAEKSGHSLGKVIQINEQSNYAPLAQERNFKAVMADSVMPGTDTISAQVSVQIALN